MFMFDKELGVNNTTKFHIQICCRMDSLDWSSVFYDFSFRNYMAKATFLISYWSNILLSTMLGTYVSQLIVKIIT